MPRALMLRQWQSPNQTIGLRPWSLKPPWIAEYSESWIWKNVQVNLTAVCMTMDVWCINVCTGAPMTFQGQEPSSETTGIQTT